MRYVFLDTETTGLDPALGHRIVEIAAVEVCNRRLTAISILGGKVMKVHCEYMD